MATQEVADGAGAGSLFTGLLLYIIDHIHLANINDFFVTLTTLGGLVWMVYKIIGQIKDNKIKDKQIEELNSDNKD